MEEQWEYTWIRQMEQPTSLLKKWDLDAMRAEDAERLNAFGQDGWEIVLIHMGAFLAKRRVAYTENN